ncbi:hypothetical protein BKK51_10455 [Rodentibacter trehalosifermentans]|uniref:HTH Mu-type domain-containing protein n=1 Tax=Rodentibacter trehalosifermentans TaxID=1908263 RepID=A0A1V3IPA5_9PAST|nr:DNA-binding protein [Rodentibacter trehalosifermentans]OOF43951.1 hypothetical protein BKK51_10455 [Rodentibacter trehalosifermentans]OOF46908.1 hypothetical protein BKK52_10380 [Rodentibacter trehalosifermentans]
MIQEWYEIKELLEVGGLATTVQGITKKAKLENWQRRRKKGVKGNVFEYYVGDMPKAVQQALGFESNPPQQSQKPQEITVEQALAVLQKALNELPKETENRSIERNNADFTAIECHLVKCFRKASEEGKEAILSTAETMAALQEKKETTTQLFENSELNVA